jgi:hypothetical protein
MREVRVGQGLLWGDVGEVGAAAPAERATAGRHDEAAHLVGPPSSKALRDGAVLGVDRHDLVGCGGRLDERAADDERLLVRQRQHRPRLEGCQGRPQTDRPRDPVEHDVGATPCGDRRGIRADDDVGHGCRPAGVRCRRGDRGANLLDLAAGDTHERHVEGDGLTCEQLDVAPGGEGGHGEGTRVRGDDLEGLGADRAGGAEDGDGAGSHGSHCQRSMTLT